MNNSTEVLRVEENGVEYFTVVKTGQSGLSISGTAKSLGVSQQSITKLRQRIEKAVTPEVLEKSLQPLFGKALTLTTGTAYKNSTILNSDCWSAFAEYYAFDSQKRTEEAATVFRAFGRIGAESYIQGKTKWLPEDQQSAHQARQSINSILDCPEPWTPMFEQAFESNLERITGLHKCHIRNSHYYWEFIYRWLTTEERIKLDAINPMGANGRRRHKIHSCIEPSTKERLRRHIQAIFILMESANTVKELRRLVQRRDGFDQGDLFDGWEF